MMEDEDELHCKRCDRVTESLYSKGPYNGNKDEGSYCLACFEDIHKEKFYDFSNGRPVGEENKCADLEHRTGDSDDQKGS